MRRSAGGSSNPASDRRAFCRREFWRHHPARFCCRDRAEAPRRVHIRFASSSPSASGAPSARDATPRPPIFASDLSAGPNKTRRRCSPYLRDSRRHPLRFRICRCRQCPPPRCTRCRLWSDFRRGRTFPMLDSCTKRTASCPRAGCPVCRPRPHRPRSRRSRFRF